MTIKAIENSSDVTPIRPTNFDELTPQRGDYAAQWSHHKVGTLVISTANFIVHIDDQGDLEWETTPKYDSDIQNKKTYDRIQHNAILNDATILEVAPQEGLNSETKKHYLRLIGEALARCLDTDYEGAKRMHSEARLFYKSRSDETSKKWYLIASLRASSVFLVMGIFAWVERSFLRDWLGHTAFWLLLAMCMGAIGALFSIISRTEQIKCDSSAGKELHNLEAALRIISGATGGLLAGLAFKSEIILAPLIQGDHKNIVFLLAALAAGTGERLTKSIISKFDDPTANSDN